MDEPCFSLPVAELSRTSDTEDGKLVLQPERWPLLRHNTYSSSSSGEEVHGRLIEKEKSRSRNLVRGTNQKRGEEALQKFMLQPGGTPTKIFCLTQVVTSDDLGDDEEYEDIMEDMRQEGGKFGNLVNVVIPRAPYHVFSSGTNGFCFCVG